MEILYSLLSCATNQFYLIDSARNEEDFLISLMIIGSLFFAVTFILIIVCTLIFVGILLVLFTAGVVSTSVLVGFHKQSLSAGFKALFISASVILTVVVSVLFFIFSNVVYGWTTNTIAIICGIIFGFVSGWPLGLLLFMAFRKFIFYLKSRFVPNKQISDANEI